MGVKFRGINGQLCIFKRSIEFRCKEKTLFLRSEKIKICRKVFSAAGSTFQALIAFDNKKGVTKRLDFFFKSESDLSVWIKKLQQTLFVLRMSSKNGSNQNKSKNYKPKSKKSKTTKVGFKEQRDKSPNCHNQQNPINFSSERPKKASAKFVNLVESGIMSKQNFSDFEKFLRNKNTKEINSPNLKFSQNFDIEILHGDLYKTNFSKFKFFAFIKFEDLFLMHQFFVCQKNGKITDQTFWDHFVRSNLFKLTNPNLNKTDKSALKQSFENDNLFSKQKITDFKKNIKSELKFPFKIDFKLNKHIGRLYRKEFSFIENETDLEKYEKSQSFFAETNRKSLFLIQSSNSDSVFSKELNFKIANFGGEKILDFSAKTKNSDERTKFVQTDSAKTKFVQIEKNFSNFKLSKNFKKQFLENYFEPINEILMLVWRDLGLKLDSDKIYRKLNFYRKGLKQTSKLGNNNIKIVIDSVILSIDKALDKIK
ncbi:hypothetical protein MHBO_001253 [Bonamia ostreae]|uniref:PH domain-containing protein n=1 Tax=Bonamia ostreae TaxID=126728 RepID=A0ABV2AIA1_9EUKA